ncbi:hypothetical protein EVAR_49999_1 [Eumeta japonica]|uniref:Uncharacterized protein n=1 Tax=Eumeta variegata TaxID=151549 RepID=A0A4C1XQD0_EUMVA|nr:hypothetical protein EVAR_49999_1 [Eumeta japonica]
MGVSSAFIYRCSRSSPTGVGEWAAAARRDRISESALRHAPPAPARAADAVNATDRPLMGSQCCSTPVCVRRFDPSLCDHHAPVRQEDEAGAVTLFRDRVAGLRINHRSRHAEIIRTVAFHFAFRARPRDGGGRRRPPTPDTGRALKQRCLITNPTFSTNSAIDRTLNPKSDSGAGCDPGSDLDPTPAPDLVFSPDGDLGSG